GPRHFFGDPLDLVDVLRLLDGEQNDRTLAVQLPEADVRRARRELLEKRRVVHAQHRDHGARLDVELVDESSWRANAFGPPVRHRAETERGAAIGVVYAQHTVSGGDGLDRRQRDL